MRDLALIGILTTAAALPACTDKGDTESATETTESTGTTGTTDPGSTTASTGDESTTSEPTTGATGSTTEDATGSTTAPLDDDCAFLIGKKFISKVKSPCGPPPDPNDPGELCPDTVSFTADTFQYMSGDYGVGGPYTCDAGKITGTDEFDMYSGQIDASTGLLVWQGTEFLPE